MALNRANELGRSSSSFDERRGIQRVHLGLIVVLFPVKIVQKANNAPEFFVLGIEFTCEIPHGRLNRFAVFNVERVFVVLLQQIECRFSRHASIEFRHGVASLFLRAARAAQNEFALEQNGTRSVSIAHQRATPNETMQVPFLPLTRG